MARHCERDHLLIPRYPIRQSPVLENHAASRKPAIWKGRIPLFVVIAACVPLVSAEAAKPGDFFTQSGEDVTFAEVMKSGDLPRGRNSKKGFGGSRVKVNHDRLRGGPNARRMIPKDIFLHTLGNSLIPRRDFPNWSRWYQEDGNTQVFRLFEGETNVRNSRPFAARIEAFSEVSWKEGDWHEWVGTFAIIKPHRMIIFQARNEVNDWSVQLNTDDDGDVILNRRVGEDEVIARNMVGKPFHVRVRDNGLDYEVFLNGRKVGDGSYERPEGYTNFRWGLYRGSRAMTHDAMILVTGAAIDPRDAGDSEQVAEEAPEKEEVPKAEEESVPEGLAIAERKWTNREGETVTAPGVYKPGEDFFSIEVGDKWVVYPLDEMSDADRAALMQAMDFIDE